MRDSSRPLVVFIMCDELAGHALGAYGNPICQTPNIDRLASQSMQFDACYVQSPICLPSRASIATGQYMRSHGGLDNSCQVVDDTVSLYGVARDAGYHTTIIGKSHFGRAPADFGFTETVPINTGGIGPFGIADPTERQLAQYRRLPGNLPLIIYGRYPRPGGQTDAALVADQAVQRIHELGRTGGLTDGGPTFLYLSFTAPHTPLLPPVPFDSMYPPESVDLPPNFRASLTGKPLLQRYYYESRGFSRLDEMDYRRAKSAYYAMTSHVDQEIGRVLDTLKAVGLFDDSIIVFTSDHGSMMGEHGWIEKWGHFYEQVVRVPLLIRVPGAAGNGSRSPALVEAIDTLPTVLDCIGLEPPSSVQGSSLLPILRADSDHHRAVVFSEWFTGGVLSEPCVMARTDSYKLCVYPDQAGIERRLPVDHPARFTDAFDPPVIEGELYDLRSDPWEVDNRFDDPAMAPVRKELMNDIEAWAGAQEPRADWELLTPSGPPAWSQFRFEQGGLAREVEPTASRAVQVRLTRRHEVRDGGHADSVRSS